MGLSMGKRAATFLCLAVLAALALPSMAGAQTTREGVFRATISDDFAAGEATTTYSLHSGGRATPLLPTEPVRATTGDRVVATGAMREGTLVGTVAQEQDLTPEADLVEPRRVAVLLVGFPGESAPWSPAQARNAVFTGERSANAFFQEESYGEISLAGELDPEGDVFGPYTVNSGGGCAADTWDDEARGAAEDAGVSLAGYDHIVYVFPFQPSCPWLGRASLGGGTVNINGTLGGAQVIAHELGHNLHLGHAGSWNCTRGGVRVQVSDTCTTSVYGDPFDVMGNLGMRHNSAWNLLVLGILGLNDNVDSVGSSGTYTLRAALSPSPAPQVLRIARPVNKPGAPVNWYYLEVRERGGIFEDFSDDSMTGVSIRVLGASSTAETVLIDSTPSTSSFYDAPFQVGHTFSDGNVHVTVLSAGGGTATVSVGFGAYKDEEAPSAPTNLSASQVGEDVKLQWSASDDNVSVSRYVVFRDGEEIGANPSTNFTDASPALGPHAYTVYAEDEAGNRGDPSAAEVATVTEVPPTAPDTPEGETPAPSPTPPGEPPHAVTVRVVGQGRGAVGDGIGAISCPPTCSHTYAAGAQVSLTATPAPGSRFDGWLGGGCAGTGACRLTIGTERTVTAVFVKAPPARSRLRIGLARRAKRSVVVGGQIVRRAHGAVRVKIVAFAHGRRLTARGRARITHGRWRTRLALPSRARARGTRIYAIARFKRSPGVRGGFSRQRVGFSGNPR